MGNEAEYTPAMVERGLRALISWETKSVADVNIVSIGHGVYEVRVVLDQDAVPEGDKRRFTREMKDVLPDRYLLKLTWV